MLIAGLDEAGRGAFFGPVYTAIVIIGNNKDDVEEFKQKALDAKIVIRDSKKMTELQRNKARKFIEENVLAYVVEYQNNTSIDTNGILKATMRCFNDSVGKLEPTPSFLYVDGNYFINENTNIPFECVEQGDDKILEIACASILAKTHRDEFIVKFCNDNPEYDEKYCLKRNKGYGTIHHRDGLTRHGLSMYHRKTFCKKFL